MTTARPCLGCGREKDPRHFVTESGRIDTQCAECRHNKRVKKREAAKARRHVEAMKAFIIQAKNPDTPVLDLTTLAAKLVTKIGGPDVFCQEWADDITYARTRVRAGTLSPKIVLDANMAIGRMMIAASEQQRDEDVSAMTDDQLRSVIETLSANTELRLADLDVAEEDDEAEGADAKSA